MLEDFIVPRLAAVVFPGWLLIMDNAPSHKAMKALEWYQTMLDEAGWALFSCQDTRHTHTHTQTTVKATRAPPKCALCTTPQALVVSFSRPLAALTWTRWTRGLGTQSGARWSQFVAVSRSRRRRRGLGLLCVLASNLGLWCMIETSTCRCASLPTVALLGTSISSGSLDL